MRVYEVDIIADGANLKFLTRTFSMRLAEFILGVGTSEPGIITSVTTQVTNIGRVTEKTPWRSDETALARMWTATRTYEVTLHEASDPVPVPVVDPAVTPV